MQDDWSYHISDFSARIAKLTDALNMKQYKRASDLATGMIADLAKVCAWIINESINKGKA